MKIYAHRGASGEHPEMTRTAYLAAIQDGADGFECDVRLSKAGEIICIHDATTKRIAGKRLRVSRNVLKTLQSLHELITLNELLDLAISAKKDLLIETKHPNIFGGLVERKVIELLNSNSRKISDAGIEVIVMSFSRLAIRRINSQWKTCKVSKYYLPASFAKGDSVALDINLVMKYPALVEKFAKRGARIFIWTVNDKVEFEFCNALSVDGVITNFPRVARNYG